MQNVWLLDEATLFFRFGIALLIGILVGIQREYSFKDPGTEHPGIRTFALMGLIGCTSAMASGLIGSPLPFVSVIFVVGGFFTVTYFIGAWKGQSGLTTPVSALITVLAGALVFWGQISLGIALAVATTVMLSLKLETHRFVERLTREDLYATLKFAVISAIILPILPNKTFGPPPFDVFNPFVIWSLVVFISGINFIGYILIKTMGTQKGMGLTGILGGIASSTAITMALSQRSRSEEALSQSFALAILIAWAIMFARLLGIIAVLNVELALLLWKSMLIPCVVGLCYAAFLFMIHRSGHKAEVSVKNPFELWPAITFGVLFLAILFISRAAQTYLGDQGIYLTSFLSGLADVDAIALSLTQLSDGKGGIGLSTAARAIMFATVANTFLKGMFTLGFGAPAMRKTMIPGFLFLMCATILGVFIT
ncbi:MAG TPA: MgtC/SapB family protein [Deltaproteobacteria bacterium]|nr:MgtC/SapB family protein [Deltaproteobacteria bacterium]HOI07556.1 MgtC/SapB family protein [Deltaproteobacteria bacterium]